MMLNAPISGPQAWLLLAMRRGYLSEAGVELELVPGTGAYNAAPEHVRQGCDISHGDIHALAEVWSAVPETAPIACYATFRRSAAAVAVLKEGPIRQASELRGARLLGHGSDVGLRTFPAFAASVGLPPGSVIVDPVEDGFAELHGALREGKADGFFGYISTITAALASRGIDADAALHWLRFSEEVPDAYGSVVMLSRALAVEEPALCREFVAAIDRGMHEAMAEPDAALDAVASFGARASRETDMIRWQTTLREEFAPQPDDHLPHGGVDPHRLSRSLAGFAQAIGLKRIPTAHDLFTDAFLSRPVAAGSC